MIRDVTLNVQNSANTRGDGDGSDAGSPGGVIWMFRKSEPSQTRYCMQKGKISRP